MVLVEVEKKKIYQHTEFATLQEQHHAKVHNRVAWPISFCLKAACACCLTQGSAVSPHPKGQCCAVVQSVVCPPDVAPLQASVRVGFPYCR